MRMSSFERHWLLLAAALASGLGCATLAKRGTGAWTGALLAAVVVMLLGYGRRWRAWPFVCTALLGVALGLHASIAVERERRETPWLNVQRLRASGSGGGWAPLMTALSSCRADFSRRVGLGLDAKSEAVSLNRAILLGERSALPKATKQRFIESGTIHVFAISGLHVMIVARVLMFLVALVFVPCRMQGAVALPFVWLYVALVGWTPSAVRAATMATFYFSAPLFWRRSNGLVAWAATFLVVHVANPGQIADVGSALSFVVMLALVIGGRVTKAVFAGRWQTLILTLTAWAAGVPIAAMVFGRVTPGGIFANLVLIAAAVYSVVAGAVGLLASYVCETLAVHFNRLSALMTETMSTVANLVSRCPGANLEVRPWGFVECALWYLALAGAMFIISRIGFRRNLI